MIFRSDDERITALLRIVEQLDKYRKRDDLTPQEYKSTHEAIQETLEAIKRISKNIESEDK